MSTKSETGKYLFLMRGGEWKEDLSADEIQQFVTDFTSWCEKLNQNGKIVASHPLSRGGKTVSGSNGQTVADGPIAEAKEAVGGFFLIEADSYEDAVELAQNCPMLSYGGMVEVRMVTEECSTFKKAAALAGAADIKMH